MSELRQLWIAAGGAASPDWDFKPVEELLATPKAISVGVMYPGEHSPGGIPLVRVSDVDHGIVGSKPTFCVTQEVNEEYKRTELHGDELLITLVGNPGDCVVVTPEMKGWNVARALAVLRLKEPKNRLWLKYILSSCAAKHLIDARLNTTVQKTLNLKDIKELVIPVPPEAQRNRITNLLSVLDQKIELNRRTNETLETMARALFKDWFIDFGPVRAKMEGRQPPGLAPEIAALFPDRLDEDGKPEGWSSDVLGAHVLNFDSKRVPLSGAERAKRRGIYPYHGATSVMDYVDDHLFDGIYLLVGEDGSVMKEDGAAFTQYVWGKFWVNNHAHVLQGKGAVTTEQLLMFFEHAAVLPFVTGAVQLKLSQGRMNSMPFLYAGESLCQEFSRVLAPLFERIRINTDENRRLSALRDLLLPKLLSGELTVCDAEKDIEKVA